MIANLLDYVISNDSSTTSMIDYLFEKIYASSFPAAVMLCVQPQSPIRRSNLSGKCVFVSRAEETRCRTPRFRPILSQR